MAYSLTYSLGTITVVDTTLNTATSLSLPGRNYAGYGAPVDQNQLSLLENFASYPTTGPSNAIPGQTWFDTATSTFNINISSSSTADWQTLLVSNSDIDMTNLTVSGNANIGGDLYVSGNIFGYTDLTLSGDLYVTGNIVGYSNVTVTDALTTVDITTGANTTAGSITGTWTLTTGSSLSATYADLGERFASDTQYDAGTVVELGGSAEITAVRDELSEIVFGVISESAGMIMNGQAGPRETHPIVAMTGRVPVKVRGRVVKGDRLVSAGNGYARSAKINEATPFNTVGRSLENKTTDSEGTVLAAVSAKL